MAGVQSSQELKPEFGAALKLMKISKIIQNIIFWEKRKEKSEE